MSNAERTTPAHESATTLTNWLLDGVELVLERVSDEFHNAARIVDGARRGRWDFDLPVLLVTRHYLSSEWWRIREQARAETLMAQGPLRVVDKR